MAPLLENFLCYPFVFNGYFNVNSSLRSHRLVISIYVVAPGFQYLASLILLRCVEVT